MSYKKKGTDEIFEATQLTADAIVNVGGDCHALKGFWLVSKDGVNVECPSDEGFKENYAETKSQAKVSQQVTEPQN